MKKHNNMKPNYRSTLFAMIVAASFVAIYISSCKKIDLTRIAVIDTEPVSNVEQTSANANGNIIDLGTNLTDHGFCWSRGSVPTINDSTRSGGQASNTGEFSLNISGLQQNTDYRIRSFIIDDAGVTYGDSQYFKTIGEFIAKWLHYDDGTNYDGIGYTEGGSWDVSIRYPKEDIQEYAGGNITKIKFFPMEGTITEYYVTIWEGDDPPELMLEEYVSNLNINEWTEYTLSNPYPINTNKDLWVGYWIDDQPADTYPAGVDDGPAINGFGDMFSNDGGDTWNALSLINPPDLDYNWNLQFFVENSKGIVTKVSKEVKKPKNKESNLEYMDNHVTLQSKNHSNK